MKMQIKDVNVEPQYVREDFANLNVGDVFEYTGDLYIKTPPITDYTTGLCTGLGTRYDAISLADGTMHVFARGDVVNIVTSELRYKNLLED